MIFLLSFHFSTAKANESGSVPVKLVFANSRSYYPSMKKSTTSVTHIFFTESRLEKLNHLQLEICQFSHICRRISTGIQHRTNPNRHETFPNSYPSIDHTSTKSIQETIRQKRHIYTTVQQTRDDRPNKTRRITKRQNGPLFESATFRHLVNSKTIIFEIQYVTRLSKKTAAGSRYRLPGRIWSVKSSGGFQPWWLCSNFLNA